MTTDAPGAAGQIGGGTQAVGAAGAVTAGPTGYAASIFNPPISIGLDGAAIITTPGAGFSIGREPASSSIVPVATSEGVLRDVGATDVGVVVVNEVWDRLMGGVITPGSPVTVTAPWVDVSIGHEVSSKATIPADAFNEAANDVGATEVGDTQVAVPEPGTLVLLGLGLAGARAARRRA